MYRATELLAQIRLLDRFELDTAAVPIDDSRLPEVARARLAASLGPQAVGRDTKAKIGLVAAYELLADFQDELGLFFRQTKPTLLTALERRNSSFFAHGLTPIGESQWSAVAQPWRQWLEEALEVARR